MDEPEVLRHGERISRIEAALESLNSDISRLASLMSDMARTMQTRGRTDWGVLAAWGAIIIMVGGYVTATVKDDISTVYEIHQREIDNIEERIIRYEEKMERRVLRLENYNIREDRQSGN